MEGREEEGMREEERREGRGRGRRKEKERKGTNISTRRNHIRYGTRDPELFPSGLNQFMRSKLQVLKGGIERGCWRDKGKRKGGGGQ